MAENLWFFDHFHLENGGEEAAARSYANEFEAKMVVCLARHLIRQGYRPEEIAVLTPYPGPDFFLKYSKRNKKELPKNKKQIDNK